jgi:hypothetical protein
MKSIPILKNFFGCCPSTDEQSAKTMAQRVRQNLSRGIGMLEYWNTAFIRIDPTLHDSTTPSFHVFI